MDDSNRIMVAAWNSVLYEQFCRFRHLIVEGLSHTATRRSPAAGFPLVRAYSTLDAASATAPCALQDVLAQVAKRSDWIARRTLFVPPRWLRATNRSKRALHHWRCTS